MNKNEALDTLRLMRSRINGQFPQGEGMPKILADLYQMLEDSKTPTGGQLKKALSKLRSLSNDATKELETRGAELAKKGERPGDNHSCDPQVQKLVQEYWQSYWANNAFTNLIDHLS